MNDEAQWRFIDEVVKVTMTVVFDGSTGTWRVIASDGHVVMDGFTSNAQAWRRAYEAAEAAEATAH